MANALVNIRFIENSRGGQTLVHNDFLFRLKTRKGDYSIGTVSTRIVVPRSTQKMKWSLRYVNEQIENDYINI